MDLEAVTRIVRMEDLAFPVVDYGQGPAVLLLHGFPDSRHLWRYQIPVLVRAGLRVIAPDLRGFGDAPKPASVEAYQVSIAAQDMIAILDALQVTQASIVGHDWGAAVAWVLAAYYPQRVERLVSLAVGCPGTSGLRTIEQRERFWYFYFFQFEGIAEEWLRHDDWKLFREWTRGDGDTERYLQDLSRPGALTAALNWYRANVKPESPTQQHPDFPTIKCPVMGIWSDGDHYLTEGHLRNSHEKVNGTWRYERIKGASHWMMLDKPEELNRLLIEFLGEPTAAVS
jgi:pimeloyl-ACP methyl ester carboxylesterase